MNPPSADPLVGNTAPCGGPPSASEDTLVDARHTARGARRLASIRHYQLDDMTGRRDLEGLAELAARLSGAKHAMISYITDTHLKMLSAVGFDATDVPLDESICTTVLYDSEPFVTSDLLSDERFHDSYAAMNGGARFYATFQLALPGTGERIGSLCVFDPEPRTLDDDQQRAMKDIAARIGDVLELDLRTRQLTRTITELERSNEELAAFAGQVSHDLRNPLGAVSGNLELIGELLEDDAPDLGTVAELVGRAQHTTGRMGRLLDDVLQFATLGGRLSTRWVDVRSLVDAVRDDLATAVEGATLDVGPLADVEADPVQLRIVVQNLVTNAVKYAAPGRRPHVEIDAREVDDAWVLRVVDHGVGVDEADRERIFEPFVRVDGTVVGTGMGLATCRRVVGSHGGTIRMDATPGGGATVVVTLPRTGAGAPADA